MTQICSEYHFQKGLKLESKRLVSKTDGFGCIFHFAKEMKKSVSESVISDTKIE